MTIELVDFPVYELDPTTSDSCSRCSGLIARAVTVLNAVALGQWLTIFFVPLKHSWLRGSLSMTFDSVRVLIPAFF